MAHPDLAHEQAYVDAAYLHLDRMRGTIERAASAVDGEVAALAMETWARRRLRTFGDAEQGLCFGRLDLDEASRPLYIGRRWVHDDAQQAVVVNWQAPAARPFYTATPAEPQRVRLRRRFRTEGRRVLDLSDEALDGSALDGVAVADFLLEELDRAREGRMRDIVTTIQADQYRLITAEPDGALVVQGGPGTGKTAVGLHRASWLLFTHEELRRRGILVVGPNPLFMEYVSHVLPALGEDAVEQRAVAELLDGVEVTREDSPEVARQKADPELAEAVRVAVEQAVRPHPEELLLYVDGAFVRVRRREVSELLEAVEPPYGIARERLRIELVRRFYRDYGAKLGAGAYRSGDEIERALSRKGFLGKYLDRVLPLPNPETLVRRVLAERLHRRQPRGWSVHDLPLLDEARALVDRPPHGYGHVIVDEAQDLTPMQLRMIARRSGSGALTILGDVAQATGPVVYASWRELGGHLPMAMHVEELRHAYRVPAEIMELALPLLATIAPDVEPPLAYRTGGEPPRFVAGGLDRALAEAAAFEEGLVAVIGPPSLAVPTRAPADADGHPFDETGIPVLTAPQAKGLEFDHVVVVEPAAIVAEGGLRELYVALTRPTKTLVVVHAEPLPPELAPA